MTATFNFFGKKLREPSTHMKLKRFTTSHDTHELIRIAILTKRYLRFLFTGLGVFRSKSSKLNGFQRCNQAYFGFTQTKNIYIYYNCESDAFIVQFVCIYRHENNV